MGVRVRDGEDTKWQPTEEPVDLGVLGLTGLVEEYDELEVRIKRDTSRRDEIKEALKNLGRDRVVEVNGKPRFELRADGQFMSAQFRKEYPGYFADFTHKVMASEFDLKRFQEEMPALYKQFRAPKIIRIKN